MKKVIAGSLEIGDKFIDNGEEFQVVRHTSDGTTLGYSEYPKVNVGRQIVGVHSDSEVQLCSN